MELREVKKQNTNNVRKKRRRTKSRAAVVVILVFLVLFIIFAVLSQTVLFPIKNIAIGGNSLYTAEQIKSAANLKEGDKLFSVLENPINKKLTEKLPYIKSVEVKHRLPDSLELTVTETAAAYSFVSSGGYYLVDSEYKVLEAVSQPKENTVIISYPTKVELTVGKYIAEGNREIELAQSVLSELKANEVEILSLEIMGYDIIHLNIQDRFTVNLGSSDVISGKLAHLGSMIKEIDNKNGPNCKGKIDLTAWSESKREGYFQLQN